MHTYIIAEAGSNHGGYPSCALELIKTAKDCGADAVKFQYWSRPERLVERRHLPEDALTTFRRYQFHSGWLSFLHSRSQEIGIDFLCTTYLPEDIAVVDPYVKMFKIASFEAMDTEFIDAHRKFRKPLIISTGMMGADDFRSLSMDILLHCTSAYPAPLEEANLSAIRSLRSPKGYSDHTKSVLTGAMAVAAGAEYVEVHFRLDTTPEECPDYATSLNPSQLNSYCGLIRTTEILMGDPVKHPQPSEANNMKFRCAPSP